MLSKIALFLPIQSKTLQKSQFVRKQRHHSKGNIFTFDSALPLTYMVRLMILADKAKTKQKSGKNILVHEKIYRTKMLSGFLKCSNFFHFEDTACKNPPFLNFADIECPRTEKNTPFP